MPRSYWRDMARQVCEGTLREWQALPDDEQTETRLRSMLRQAHPFGERRYTPYKVHWLSEQRRALSLAGFMLSDDARAAQQAREQLIECGQLELEVTT